MMSVILLILSPIQIFYSSLKSSNVIKELEVLSHNVTTSVFIPTAIVI